MIDNAEAEVALVRQWIDRRRPGGGATSATMDWSSSARWRRDEYNELFVVGK